MGPEPVKSWVGGGRKGRLVCSSPEKLFSAVIDTRRGKPYTCLTRCGSVSITNDGARNVTSCTKAANSDSSVLGKLLPPQNLAICLSPDAPQLECHASNLTCPVAMRHTTFSVSSASSKCLASSRDCLCSICLASLQAFVDDLPLGPHRHR